MFQVLAFVLAAAVRRIQVGKTLPGPASRSEDWPVVQERKIKLKAVNPLAMVTYHPEYHSYIPKLSIESLEAINELGASWVRSDIRWRDILPDGIRPDARAIQWHENFLNSAIKCGLKNMVVLSSPPTTFSRQTAEQKLESWLKYVEVVVACFGDSCSSYQLMNEPNNPVYRFFSIDKAAEALAKGASIIHNSNPSAKVAVNISMEIWGWKNYLTELLSLSEESVDIIGLDHYPGTWTVGVHERWSEIEYIVRGIASAHPTSIWYNRQLAVMETGFSTNTISRNEASQAIFFKNLNDNIQTLMQLSPSKILLGIYELCDGDSSAWLDPEAHFGLLTTDLERKSGFGAAQELIASLR